MQARNNASNSKLHKSDQMHHSATQHSKAYSHYMNTLQFTLTVGSSGFKLHPKSGKHRGMYMCLVWLNLFHAELFPKWYWQGPRSQEVGERGRLYPTSHCHTRMISALRTGNYSNENHFNICEERNREGQSHMTVSTYHNFWGVMAKQNCVPA